VTPVPQWLVLLSSFAVVLGLVTAAAIALNLVAHPQPMRIMNVVWPVTGLYLPLAGWWLYRAIGRPMPTDTAHRGRERPFWQSVLLSATHCGGGCVVGDVIGAPLVFATGWTILGHRLFADYVVEFALAYICGIAFQYLPIRTMRQVSRGEALLDAVKADTLSLLAFEIGMFLWMAIVAFLLFAPRPPEPESAVFWFMMQLGMALGLVTTYPANWLLVRSGIKSGM
jgi:hypothetical protein